MQYLKSGPFTVQMGGDQNYRANYDAIDWSKGKDKTSFTALEVDGTVYCTENYEEGQNAPTNEEILANGEVAHESDLESIFNEGLYRKAVRHGQEEYSSTIQSQVREFHRVMGQPIAESPGSPSDERVRLRLKLVAEEFFELLDACGVEEPAFEGIGVFSDIRAALDDVRASDVNLCDVADALADLAYVVEGANLEFGIDSEAVLAEVHRSNMSKLGPLGKPLLNADGKVMKGSNYSPPNIRRVLGL